MISRDSRYRPKDAYPSQDPGRTGQPAAPDQPPSGILGVLPHCAEELEVRRHHTIVAGERLDQIAHRYYGDPLKYWLICDATEVIFPDDLLVPGRVLRIPRNRI